MSFVIPCPICGPRACEEFVFLGERPRRPADGRTSLLEDFERAWLRENAVSQRERWLHADGCQRIVHALRDTATQHVVAEH